MGKEEQKKVDFLTSEFPLKKTKDNNTGLKHWIMPNNLKKTHVFLQFLDWGTLSSFETGPKGVSYF